MREEKERSLEVQAELRELLRLGGRLTKSSVDGYPPVRNWTGEAGGLV